MSVAINRAKKTDDLYHTLVNTPFDYKMEMALMFLSIIVLLLVDPKTKTLKRIALSDTEGAKAIREVSVIDFKDIKIPMSEPKNIIVQAIKENTVHSTVDWKELFVPALDADQARLNQASAGIALSAVYPFKGKRKNGALIFSYYGYPEQIGKNQKKFMKKYTKLVARAIK
jgi:hypothetical protein